LLKTLIFALAVALFAWALALPVARAQDGGSDSPLATTGPAASANQVDIEIIQFGVGDLCRSGEMVGVHVGIQDRTTKVRELILRMHLPDADGDTAWSEVTIAANPGQKQRVWIYGRIPFFFAPGSAPAVLFQVIDPSDKRVVGAFQAPIRASNLVPAWSGLMGVVGRYTVGLDRYLVRSMNGGLMAAPFGHEVTAALAQLRPGAKGTAGELPDRWYGLNQFSALVWTASSTDGEPTDLSPSQAEALVEWVKRGGHLVVVLPGAGQSWIGARDNPLTEILPRVSIARQDDADLEPLRPLLFGVGEEAQAARLPGKQILQFFTVDSRAEPTDAMPLFVDTESRCVAVRRLAGVGAVTLVGLDLTSRGFLASGGVEPGSFWHRLLGRRGPLPSNTDLSQVAGNRAAVPVDSRSPVILDDFIAGRIARQETAALGLLLAFVVFVIYWILAGPMGFALLKRGQYSQHAWVGFLGVAGLFTAIAWGGATAMRPLKISATHLTFMDHVYGQNVQRARSFISVLLPMYGDVPVSVPDSGEGFKTMMASWDEPGDGTASRTSFPDARGYTIDGRLPAGATVPARSTTRTMQIDWAGGPRWKMPAPVTQTGPGQFALGGQLVLNRAADREPLVSGILVHEMPSALSNVVVVVVKGQELRLDADGFIDRKGPSVRPGAAPAEFEAFSATGAWLPGTALDLSLITARPEGSRRLAEANFLRNLVPAPRGYGFGEAEKPAFDDSTFKRGSEALTFFSMLEPPEFTNNSWNAPPPLARRRATHGLDLGRWFTQPCIIIMGTLDGPGTCPVPLSVAGTEPDEMKTRTTGSTVLRWVYPLPAFPPSMRIKDATPATEPTP
jgi:hypothetical protein